MKGSSVRAESVSKYFGSFKALENITLSIKKGEFFSLLGPSGCGKTTLLRIIAGFESPTTGELYLDDRNILPLAPNKRHINTVFQNYALFPHLSVFENVAFPLRLKKMARQKISSMVEEYLDLVKLSDEAKKMPAQLSGGQKQRVSIARALINQPSVLLLDEPLSALDAKLRQHMLIELDTIHDKIGITFIYVTHDQQEALGVSDRVAVFSKGVIHQIGTPVEIYECPSDGFVADFIGETNSISGEIREIMDHHYARLDAGSLGTIVIFLNKEASVGDKVKVTIRPEKIQIAAEVPRQSGSKPLNLFPGVVDEIIYSGFLSKFFVRIADRTFRVFKQHIRYHQDEKSISWHDPAHIFWSADDGYIVEVISR